MFGTQFLSDKTVTNQFYEPRRSSLRGELTANSLVVESIIVRQLAG